MGPIGTHDDSTVTDGPAVVAADTSGVPCGYVVKHPIPFIAGQARTKQTQRRRQGVLLDEEESQGSSEGEENRGSPEDEGSRGLSEDEEGSGPPEKKAKADSALVPEGK
jgi:hypothetical protein